MANPLVGSVRFLMARKEKSESPAIQVVVKP